MNDYNADIQYDEYCSKSINDDENDDFFNDVDDSDDSDDSEVWNYLIYVKIIFRCFNWDVLLSIVCTNND